MVGRSSGHLWTPLIDSDDRSIGVFPCLSLSPWKVVFDPFCIIVWSVCCVAVAAAAGVRVRIFYERIDYTTPFFSIKKIAQQLILIGKNQLNEIIWLDSSGFLFMFRRFLTWPIIQIKK